MKPIYCVVLAGRGRLHGSDITLPYDIILHMFGDQDGFTSLDYICQCCLGLGCNL